MTYRVLVLARSNTTHAIAGGMERVLDETAGYLKADGALVALVTTQGGSRPTWVEPDAFWELPARRPGRYSRQWWAGTRQAGAPWYAWGPDVVLAVGDAGTAALNARAVDVPVVVHAHGTPWDEFVSAMGSGTLLGLARALVNLARLPGRSLAARRASAIMAVSPEIRERLTKAPFWVRRARISVVPNAPADEVFEFSSRERDSMRSELDVPPGSRLLVFGGRVEKDKGVDVAVALLTDPSLRGSYLAIAGAGSALDSARALAVSRGVDDRVRFLGKLSAMEFRSVLCAADVLVVPSRRREGMSMVILEALSMGVPVVASILGARGFEGVGADVISRVRKQNEWALRVGATPVSNMHASLLPRRFTRDAVRAEFLGVVRGLVSPAPGNSTKGQRP